MKKRRINNQEVKKVLVKTVAVDVIASPKSVAAGEDEGVAICSLVTVR